MVLLTLKYKFRYISHHIYRTKSDTIHSLSYSNIPNVYGNQKFWSWPLTFWDRALRIHLCQETPDNQLSCAQFIGIKQFTFSKFLKKRINLHFQVTSGFKYILIPYDKWWEVHAIANVQTFVDENEAWIFLCHVSFCWSSLILPF